MKQYAPGKEPDYTKEEKLAPAEIEIRGGVFGKLDNFWFYHKWKVIVIAAAILLFVICALQMCGNVSDDLTIMYAGSAYLPTDANYSAMIGAFESVMPEDYNGDGVKRIEMAAMNIYSKEQIEKRKAEIVEAKKQREEGFDVIVPPEIPAYINTQEYTSYSRVMQTGEYSICLLERWLYDEVAEGIFCKLSDILGSVPEYAVDEYAVNFRDTEFFKANADIFASIPEDTIFCLRTKNALSGKGNEEQFERAKETFVSVMNYRFDTPATSLDETENVVVDNDAVVLHVSDNTDKKAAEQLTVPDHEPLKPYNTVSTGTLSSYLFVPFDGEIYRYKRYHTLNEPTYAIDELIATVPYSNGHPVWPKIEDRDIYSLKESPDRYYICMKDSEGKQYLYKYEPSRGTSASVLDDAKRDGYIVSEGLYISYRLEDWNDFFKTVSEGKPASVKFADYYTMPDNLSDELREASKEDYPCIYYSTLTYDGDTFVYEGSDYKYEYKYLMRYEEIMRNTSKYPGATMVSYILVDDNSLTIGDINRSMFSSVSTDWVSYSSVCHELIPKEE